MGPSQPKASGWAKPPSLGMCKSNNCIRYLLWALTYPRVSLSVPEGKCVKIEEDPQMFPGLRFHFTGVETGPAGAGRVV